ncbi:MAG: hypothetical protein JWN66_2356 [Sphingomonas bacterium]|uniref:hypothetical protein n=1 Tax=Sphingomonas bacterium TaxID=1895847 RepID=UPI0026351EDF|nr:hypothetical protein [Sphingomonas bacterium]MDB5705240.1 hypothetical protein [Sphingomonas bacterium]
MPAGRARVGLLAALLLGGCFWEGPAFYTVDPARPGPLAPGLYQAETPDDGSAPDRLRIGRAADGALLVAPPEDYETGHPTRVVLAPLPVPGRQLWVVQARIGEPDDPVAYGLLDSAGGTLMLDPALHCEGSQALVRAAGGAVEGEGGSPSCVFKDRATLERALAAYAGAHPGLDKPTRLTRIGD